MNDFINKAIAICKVFFNASNIEGLDFSNIIQIKVRYKL